MLQKLNQEQIDFGILLVQQHHPLTDTMLWITLPYLQPIKKFIPSWVPRTTERVQEQDTTVIQEDDDQTN